MEPESRALARPEPAQEVTGRATGDATDDDPLIRWMLALTPTERLAAAQGFADSLVALSSARTD